MKKVETTTGEEVALVIAHTGIAKEPSVASEGTDGAPKKPLTPPHARRSSKTAAAADTAVSTPRFATTRVLSGTADP